MRSMLFKSLGLAAFAFLLVITTAACSGGSNPPPSPPPPSPIQYTVSTTAGEGTTIFPASTSVEAGKTTSFTVTLLAGYTNLIVTGVNGTLVGNTYTTGPVNANATVVSSSTKIAPSTYSISGTVSAAIQAGVTMTMTPENVTVTTAANGTYSFTGVYNGSHTVTPSYTGDTFSPVSANVTVIGANVVGINFVGSNATPMVTTGKILYSGANTLNVLDLSTGLLVSQLNIPSATPDFIVSMRGASKFAAYRNPGEVSYVSGILTWGLANSVTRPVIFVPAVVAPGYSSTTYGSLDVGLNPSAVNFAAVTLKSTTGKKDIFLILMDLTYRYTQATTDGVNTSPVVAKVDVNGDTTILCIKNGNTIWKQILATSGTLLGPATLFMSNVMDSTRPMSVNAAYTHLAFMKDVSGVSRITVISLAGGAEVDLGVGIDPCWTLDGTNRILFTANNALWVINQDGTGKLKVPTPTNPAPSNLSTVVFGPAGY